jgi:hypothetical protein
MLIDGLHLKGPLRNRTKAIVAIATLLVAAAVASASWKVYFLREASGGYVLWNPSEAYLFSEVVREGYYASLLRLPWIGIMQYFGAVESPHDTRASLIAIRVTSSGVERHVLKLADHANGGGGSDPVKYTPLDGRIYVQCPPLDLCRWAGDRFEKATQEERQRLDGIKRLTTTDFDNDENGWSRRGFGAGPTDRKFTIEMSDGFRILVNNLAVRGTDNATVSVDLLRPGAAPERIGAFDARDGRLSSAEYRHAFQDRE